MTKHFVLATVGLLATAFTWPSPPDKPVRMVDLLRNVQKNRTMQAARQLAEQAGDLDYHLRPVKELGIRFGADDFNDGSLRYGASVSFNSARERRLQHQQDGVVSGLFAAKEQVLLNQQMAECYRSLADLYSSNLLFRKNKQLDSLLKLQNAALRLALDRGLTISVEDLVDNEHDLRVVSLEQMKLGRDMAFAKQRMAHQVGAAEDLDVDFSTIITLGKIATLLDAMERRNMQMALIPAVIEAEEQVKMDKLQLQLEQTSDRQWFDGIQLIHQLNGDPLLNGGGSFRVGVNIPINGGTGSKQNDLILEQKQSEAVLEQLVLDQKNDARLLVKELRSQMASYSKLQSLSENSLVTKLLASPAMLANLTGTEIIELRIVNLKQEIEMSNLLSDVFQTYVNLMELTGDFVKPPMRNYLSENLEVVSVGN